MSPALLKSRGIVLWDITSGEVGVWWRVFRGHWHKGKESQSKGYGWENASRCPPGSGILCSDASQPAGLDNSEVGQTTNKTHQGTVTVWHCLGSHPASIWYQIHRSCLGLGVLHRAEGEPQVWLPAPPVVEEPMQGFPASEQ